MPSMKMRSNENSQSRERNRFQAALKYDLAPYKTKLYYAWINSE
jgi:hypothetical protein